MHHGRRADASSLRHHQDLKAKCILDELMPSVNLITFNDDEIFKKDSMANAITKFIKDIKFHKLFQSKHI